MSAHMFLSHQKFIFFSFIFLVISILLSGCAPEPTNWYVAKTGSDSNSCKTPEESCLTIQAAVDKAWKTGDHIFIAGGVYTEKVKINGKSISITGQGPANTIISGAGICTPGDSGALITIWKNMDFQPAVIIENLAIRDCKRGDQNTKSYGGGISVQEFVNSLTIRDVLLTGNSAYQGGGYYCFWNCDLRVSYSTISQNSSIKEGGGLFVRGNLTIGASSINENMAGGHGGGIYLKDSQGLVTNSIISNNRALYKGGGIYSNSNSANLQIQMCTFDGNNARAGGGLYVGNFTHIYESTISNNNALATGGAIINNNQLWMQNSTVSGNQHGGIFNEGDPRMNLMNITLANNSGKGIFMPPSGLAVIQDTLLASNGTANCDIRSPVTASGNIATDESCPGATYEVDPKIGPLANNGGPTDTHALLPGSPAIDTAQAGNSSVWQDQRENIRPYDGNSDGQAFNDVGAFEYVPQEAVSTLIAPTDVPIIYIPNKNQNCRTGPGTDWNTQGLLVAGTTLPVNGKNGSGTWVEVVMPDGTICWVLVTNEVTGIEKVPVLPDPPKPFRPTEITAPPPSLSKNCSKYTSSSACTNAGCNWIFVAVGKGHCE